MRTFLRGLQRRMFMVFTRSDAGLSSMELAVLAAILLGLATGLGLAMTGKLNDLMAAFTAKS